MTFSIVPSPKVSDTVVEPYKEKSSDEIGHIRFLPWYGSDSPCSVFLPSRSVTSWPFRYNCTLSVHQLVENADEVMYPNLFCVVRRFLRTLACDFTSQMLSWAFSNREHARQAWAIGAWTTRPCTISASARSSSRRRRTSLIRLHG